MQVGGHFPSGTRYGTDEIVAFAADGSKHGVTGQAFFDSAVAQSLRQMVPGKSSRHWMWSWRLVPPRCSVWSKNS